MRIVLGINKMNAMKEISLNLDFFSSVFLLELNNGENEPMTFCIMILDKITKYLNSLAKAFSFLLIFSLTLTSSEQLISTIVYSFSSTSQIAMLGLICLRYIEIFTGTVFLLIVSYYGLYHTVGSYLFDNEVTLQTEG